MIIDEPLVIEGDQVFFDHPTLLLSVYKDGCMIWSDRIRPGDRVESVFRRDDTGDLIRISESVSRREIS